MQTNKWNICPKFPYFDRFNQQTSYQVQREFCRRKIQHLIEIHLETCWVQRSLTTFLVAKSFLSSPYLDQSSFGEGKGNFFKEKYCHNFI
jgi:hypothetical protein